jgi:hypothetical protein
MLHNYFVYYAFISHQVMIRHTKETVAEIPKPIRKSTKIYMSPSEASVYNAFVTLAKSNLLLTDYDEKTPGAANCIHSTTTALNINLLYVYLVQPFKLRYMLLY